MKKPKIFSSKDFISILLCGIALAMGIAVTVISILGEGDNKSGQIMLGIGLFCLGLNALNRR